MIAKRLRLLRVQPLRSHTAVRLRDRRSLTCKQLPLRLRVQLFEATVVPAVLYGAGTRSYSREELRKFDACYRRFARLIVGFPARCDWERPWHEVLHQAHDFALPRMRNCGARSFRHHIARAVWRWAQTLAGMDEARWARRLLAWDPAATVGGKLFGRKLGRPYLRWTDPVDRFSRSRGLEEPWLGAATNAHQWRAMETDFVSGF